MIKKHLKHVEEICNSPLTNNCCRCRSSLDFCFRRYGAMGSSPLSVEDVVELMHHIQSRLPVKDAARTSVLSKSWLHAWSTIPTLRFHVGEGEHFKGVGVEFDRTLNRYIHDNIPIERFELDVYIDNGESASITKKWNRTVATKASSLKELSLSVELIEKWIRNVATKASTLKELSLSVKLPGTSLTLPDEILSVAKNLTKLSVSAAWMKTPVNIIINCVSLQEVVLIHVHISQEVLDGIFSSCTLLEKIDLFCVVSWDRDQDRKTMIKIKNLARLQEIRIGFEAGDYIDLEISGVPNLQLFKLDSRIMHLDDYPHPVPFSAYPISLGSSVTELFVGGLIIDESSLEMIKSGFPFLESLTLDIEHSTLPSFHFRSGSLKRLSLICFAPDSVAKLMDVQVYAPKLLDFIFSGYTLPASLSFPVSTLIQTTFNLSLDSPIDVSFFS